jgi:hypothetical protein
MTLINSPFLVMTAGVSTNITIELLTLQGARYNGDFNATDLEIVDP